MPNREKDSQALQRLLTEIATEEIPHVNLMSRFGSPPRRRPQPALTLAKIALVVIGLLAATVAAYAIYQTLTGGDPGLDAMNEADRITFFSESKPLVGPNAEEYNLVATLDYGYADANRITISYSVSGEADSAFNLWSNPTLVDDAGHQFAFLPFGGGGGGGGGGGSDPNARFTTSQGMTANFDATILEQSPESINLLLTIEAGITPLNEDGSPRADMGEFGMMLAGSAEFTITMPFDAGRTYSTPENVTVGDVQIGLNEVVVAPSMTRIVLCYGDPLPAGKTWSLQGSLTINDEMILDNQQLYTGYEDVSPAFEAAPCKIIAVPYPLNEVTGDWVLTIDRMTLPNSEDRDVVVRRMLEEHGAMITAPEGGGYMIEAQGGMESSAFDEALRQVIAEEQQTIDGPWVFTWSM